MEHRELVQALDQAKGRDLELDFWCWWHAIAKMQITDKSAQEVRAKLSPHSIPHFTDSVDASFSLMPVGWVFDCAELCDGVWVVRLKRIDGPKLAVEVYHSTFALALATACMAAHIHPSQGGPT